MAGERAGVLSEDGFQRGKLPDLALGYIILDILCIYKGHSILTCQQPTLLLLSLHCHPGDYIEHILQQIIGEPIQSQYFAPMGYIRGNQTSLTFMDNIIRKLENLEQKIEDQACESRELRDQLGTLRVEV